jgi:hypothetical protein
MVPGPSNYAQNAYSLVNSHSEFELSFELNLEKDWNVSV